MIKPCPGCAGEVLYNPAFDSYYCDKCNIWVGLVCGYPDCDYCTNRPEKPNMEKNNE